ncbi:MAG: M48 family metallopeptidase [Clostridiales bacterium]|nr:M48 family metallopeptidase [Clostridiales bacterium]
MNNLFDYNIVYKKRKTIGIEINNNGEILIKAPLGTSKDIINNILKDKNKWINQKLKKIKTRVQLNGNEIMYLGKIYKTSILVQKYLKREFVLINDNKIIINVKKRENVKDCLIEHFKKKTYDEIEKRIEVYKGFFPVEPKSIKIREQKTIWGSCSYDNKLSFNYKLIMADIKIIDYVVVHEMSHMIHKNHSMNFWKKVEEILPDYEMRKKWLNDNGYLLDLQQL